jgi:MarR family transcriptional regulator, 2-MHQ and catechol-resistance regulon repressor
MENVIAEAVINLCVAADVVRRRMDKICADSGISQSQYNILRILKEAYPSGFPRCQILLRLTHTHHAPDATRIIDRLEQQKFVERVRSEHDRRLSIARITDKGLHLVNELEPCFDTVWQEIAAKVSRAESMMLAEICGKIHEGHGKEIRVEM